MWRLTSIFGSALAIIATFTSRDAPATDKVVFGLDWVVSGQHAPFFAAKEKGFYAAEGLDVEIQRGYGSADAVKRVGAGVVTIGFGDTGSLILSRAEGNPLKVVMIVYAKPPYSLLVRKDAEITTPKDLEGKALAGPAGGAARAMFPVFAELTGVDESKVSWLTTDAANLLPVLMAGQVSGIATYYVQHVSDEARAREGGVELATMKYADHGLRIYGNGIIVSEELLQARPDLVKRFVKATVDGFNYAFANPQEVGRLLASRHPHLDAKLVAGDIGTVEELADSPEAKKHGLGYMSSEVIRETRDTVAKIFKVPAAAQIPVESIYTNEFLPSAKKTGD